MKTLKRIKVNEVSNADKVGSCDDLLTEIFLRLPVRSVLRFKSVSKHCYFLISDTSFRLLHSSRNPSPPSGLFVPVTSNKPHLEYEFVPFNIKDPVKAPFRTLTFDPNVKIIDIKHSCNGLMLCYSERIDLFNEKKCVLNNKYYLYNPSINQFTTLPRFETYDNSYICGVTLIYDPSKSPYYKIVYVFRACAGKMRYQVGIYSSQTSTCKTSKKFSLDNNIHIYFDGGVYLNNVVHWLHKTGFVLAFNLDKHRIYKTQTPFVLGDSLNYMFGSRDHLLFVEILLPFTSKFTIRKLKSSILKWEGTLKHHVNINQVAESFPEIIDPLSRVTFIFDVLSIEWGEKEDDSFMVLRIPGKVVRYNLASKTFHKLRDFPHTPAQTQHGVFRRQPCVFQFVESLHSI